MSALEDAAYDVAGEDPRKRCKNGDGRLVDVERGIYGGLCVQCREEKQRERDKEATSAPKSQRAAESANGTARLGQLARALVKPAERAEKAIHSVKAARTDQDAALRELSKGLEALRDATAAMVRE